MQTHLILIVTYRLEPHEGRLRALSGTCTLVSLPFPSTLSPEGKDLAVLLMPSAYSFSAGDTEDIQ